MVNVREASPGMERMIFSNVRFPHDCAAFASWMLTGILEVNVVFTLRRMQWIHCGKEPKAS